MSYTINNTSGGTIATVQDGTINTTALDITLIGKNFSGYGEYLNENYVKLLEHFASGTAPTTPTTGEIWYDSTNKLPKVYTGTAWKNIGSATASASSPGAPNQGDLWYDTTNKQLRVYNLAATAWDLIGPDYTTAQGLSGQAVMTIPDSSTTHIVVYFYCAGTITAILSKDATFTPVPSIAGFTTIKPGLNFNDTLSAKVADSELLDGLDSTSFMRTDTNTSTSGNLAITSSTVSTNSTTGALKVTGGAGIVGNVNVGGSISATSVTGTLTTANQSAITTVGTLGSLNVTGAIAAGGALSGTTLSLSGAVSGVTTLTASSVAGTLTTPAQANITSVGTLSSLNVTSGITAGGAISGGSVSGSTLTGTISTASQTNITAVGTLTSLAVSGTITGSALSSASGNLVLSTTSARVVTSSAVTVTSSVASDNTSTGALMVTGGAVVGGSFRAGSLYSDNLYYANGVAYTSGSGTVSSGTATRLAFYSATGTAVQDTGANLTWATATNTLAVTGNLSVRNITTTSNNSYDIGASGTVYANVWATTFRGTTTQAQYADLAEIYDTDEEYAVGTVIIVGGDREVTACTTDSNVSVAGVISEKPGLLMNDKGRGQAIALRGKVPVLIIGAIVRGDLIVTSVERGCGRSAGTAPEFKAVAFAIALESNESDSVKSVMSLIL